MRILTREQFMQMKAGTIFSYYEPSVFTGLYIKESNPEDGYNDFSSSPLIGAIDFHDTGDFFDKCSAMERGESVETDFDGSSREGLFDDNLLYAVYEEKDVEKLLAKILPSRNY